MMDQEQQPVEWWAEAALRDVERERLARQEDLREALAFRAELDADLEASR